MIMTMTSSQRPPMMNVADLLYYSPFFGNCDLWAYFLHSFFCCV